MGAGGEGAINASTGPVGCIKCLVGDSGGAVDGGEEMNASAGPPDYMMITQYKWSCVIS